MIRDNFSKESRLLTFLKVYRHKNSIKIVDLLESIIKGTNENFDYGNLYILNEYAGVPFGTKVIGRIQHGWAVGLKSGTAYTNNFLNSYVWDSKTEAWAVARGWKNMTAIGSPWLYLFAILKRDGWVSKKFEQVDSRSVDQLWVYGYHSMSVDDGIERDMISFLEQARASGEGNIKILLSYTDFDVLSRETFESFSDLQIITLGHRRNLSSANSHLYRLFDLLCNTKELHIDFPSTILLYAITTNCKVYWIRNASFTLAQEHAALGNNPVLKQMLSLEQIDSSDFMQFALESLGRDSFKSPEELRALLGWSKSGLSLSKNISQKFSTLAALPYRFIKTFVLRPKDGF